MENLVLKATKAAIRNAKYQKSTKVNKDDLLAGVLQVISRFGVAKIGTLIVDLDDFEQISRDGSHEEAVNINKQKVAYSSSANELFNKAAAIARNDNFPKVEIVHLLVAFADENSGLMADLKEKYGFSSREWRAALSDWISFSPEKTVMDSKDMIGKKSTSNIQNNQLFSPDEAADFLGVHVQTIRGYIRMGKLPAFRLAGERALRIKRESLLALLELFKPE